MTDPHDRYRKHVATMKAQAVDLKASTNEDQWRYADWLETQAALLEAVIKGETVPTDPDA